MSVVRQVQSSPRNGIRMQCRMRFEYTRYLRTIIDLLANTLISRKIAIVASFTVNKLLLVEYMQVLICNSNTGF